MAVTTDQVYLGIMCQRPGQVDMLIVKKGCKDIHHGFLQRPLWRLDEYLMHVCSVPRLPPDATIILTR